MKLEKFGIIAGLASVALAVYAYVFPPMTEKQLPPELIGRWSSDYGYPYSGGTVRVNGVTEYFEAGNYNFNGKVHLLYGVGDGSIDALYRVTAAGEWDGDEESLSIKLRDFKSHIIHLQHGDKLIDVGSMERLLGIKVPALDEFIPAGTADVYKIVALAKNSVVLEADDPLGNPFGIAMNRTKAISPWEQN